MKLGLENITGLLEALGDPQKKVPSVLVAGTNGKGSVTTFISSILRKAGFRTGIFYSPHLFRINERIRIDGDEIGSRVLDGILGELRERYELTPFTFFEGITAAAIVHFVRSRVDIAVFEVGLGGRLDATRLVEAGCTVITGISRDHREHLGRSRRKILVEKLGIARKGVPMVANLDTPSLSRQAEEYCEAASIPFIDVRRGVKRRIRSIEPGRIEFRLSTPERDYGLLTSKLIGKAQIENATTAVRAAEVIGSYLPAVGEGAIREGIAEAFFHGRFQVLPGDPRIILDVSHNEQALLEAVSTLGRISSPQQSVLLFGVMARKELGRFPSAALKASRLVVLTPLGAEGGATREDLKKRFAGRVKGSAEVIMATGMEEAVRLARRSLRPGDTLLILGSHHTVEAAAGFIQGPDDRKGPA